MECSKMESKEDSKESGVSLKSDWSKYFKIWSSVRVRLESLQSAISCASAERDDSQGRTAHIKETPPSPKEKPEDLIGADIDSVRDDEDLVKSSYSLMAKGSMESIDSGVSLKSDWSRSGLINFKDSSCLSMPCLYYHYVNTPVIHLNRLFKSSDDLMAKGSMESNDSGVSFKSDRSKDGLIDFKDSSSLKMPRRRIQSDPVKSNFLIPLSQQSPVVMATRSFEAFGSSLSSMNDSVIRNRQRFLPRMVLRSMDTFGSSLSSLSDSFIDTGQRSPPREEMNQELSSEVGWEHR